MTVRTYPPPLLINVFSKLFLAFLKKLYLFVKYDFVVKKLIFENHLLITSRPHEKSIITCDHLSPYCLNQHFGNHPLGKRQWTFGKKPLVPGIATGDCTGLPSKAKTFEKTAFRIHKVCILIFIIPGKRKLFFFARPFKYYIHGKRLN